MQVWSLSRTLCHFQVTIPRCVRWQLTLATWLYTVVLRILSLSTVKAIASNHIEMRISGCFTQVHNKTNIGSKPISHNPYRYIHIYIYYNIYLYKIYLYVYIINIYIYRLDILESFNHLSDQLESESRHWAGKDRLWRLLCLGIAREPGPVNPVRDSRADSNG